jgi:hypothetical protein
MVTVTSPDGSFRTKYLHLSAINVKDGQEISEKDKIGEIGGSRKGEEYGGQVHLHYQIEKKNSETGEYEPYNPTEGKGNKEKNIVDPQSWIKNPSGSTSSSGDSESSVDDTSKYPKFPPIYIPTRELKEAMERNGIGSVGPADRQNGPKNY